MNFEANGGVLAYAGEGVNNSNNSAVAINHVVNGLVEASTGFGDDSNRNKATAITTADAGDGAKTYVHVNIGHDPNNNDSGAQLVNTAAGCQEAQVPYDSSYPPNRCP